jgi:phage-related protein
MDTFNPAWPPTVGQLAREVTPRILTASFGDGYRQEAGDGLNAIARSMDLGWSVLELTDADDIEAFFEAHRGYQAFLWTAPNEAVQRKWKCTTWSRQAAQALQDSITAHFEQVFDL